VPRGAAARQPGCYYLDMSSPARLRGIVPARVVETARRLRKRPEVSQRRLREFLRDFDRRPRLTLPREAPGSIAVVVPCYGHAAFLPDTFESLLAQTRPPDEVVLVDDCSPDDTAAVLAALVAAHPELAGGRVSVLRNDRNIGQAASLNRGIAAASSDLIMILNDDDYLMHDAIESMLSWFGRHRDAALIGAHCIYFTGPEALAAAPKVSTDYAAPGLPLTTQRPQDVPGYRNYNDLNMTHSGSCFFKVAWEAVGGYRADAARRVVPFSDRDFQLRVNAVWPVAVAYETPLALWREGSSVDAGVNS
jgi:glycosyltransferase involved in cell wall biosynthesis